MLLEILKDVLELVVRVILEEDALLPIKVRNKCVDTNAVFDFNLLKEVVLDNSLLSVKDS